MVARTAKKAKGPPPAKAVAKATKASPPARDVAPAPVVAPAAGGPSIFACLKIGAMVKIETPVKAELDADTLPRSADAEPPEHSAAAGCPAHSVPSMELPPAGLAPASSPAASTSSSSGDVIVAFVAPRGVELHTKLEQPPQKASNGMFTLNLGPPPKPFEIDLDSNSSDDNPPADVASAIADTTSAEVAKRKRAETAVQLPQAVATVGAETVQHGADAAAGVCALPADGAKVPVDVMKFNNNIRSKKLAQPIKDKWAELKVLPKDDLERQEFVKRLSDVSVKSLDADPYFQKITTGKVVEHEKTHGDKGGWKTYHKCVKDDGAPLVDEIIRLKCTETRENKKLVAGHKVPWPHNLELDWSDEVWSNLTKARETIAFAVEGPATDDAMQSFDDAFRSARAGTPARTRTPTSAAPDAAAETTDGLAKTVVKLEEEEKKRQRVVVVKEAVRQLTTAHTVWDRRRRDFNATILRAKGNINTKDSPVLVQLSKLVEDGDAVDVEVQKLLHSYDLSQDLSTEDIETQGHKCDAVVNLVKEASKKSAALQGFMKA